MSSTKQTSSPSPTGGGRKGAASSNSSPFGSDRKGGCSSSSSSRIGIFGGSFNPVHNGHVELARQLLHAARLDEIWFVVSPRNPLKNREELLDDNIRLRMVRMALQDEPQLVASDYEFGMPRPSYMWHTLQSMSKDYPGREFVLLIGADNWACFDRWFAWREILAHYPVVVYPRGGSPVDIPLLPVCVEDKKVDEAPAPLPCVRLADTRLLDVSSTEIRRRIKSGEPFARLVPPAVGAFILSEGLYGCK